MSIDSQQKNQIDSVKTLFSNNQLDEALAKVNILIKSYPNESLLFNIAGACYAGLQQFEKAVDSYKQAILINPDYSKALYNLADTYHELNNFDAALKSYEKAIKINPNFAEAHNNLGNLFGEFGQLDQAIKSYKNAIALNSNYLEAQYSLSIIFQNLEEFEDMIVCLKKVIAIKPDFAEAHHNLGIAYNGLGKFDNSVDAFRAAIVINPDYLEAHNNLGDALKELDQLEDAMHSYENAIALQPDYPILHNNLGDTLKELGKFDDAIKSYKKAISFNTENPDSHNRLGVIFFERDELEKAISAFEKALSIDPNYEDALNNLGVVLNKSGFSEDAVECYEKALSINPNYSDALKNKGVALKKLGRIEEATIVYEKALLIDPNDADTLNNIGITLMNSERLEEAIKSYEKAIKLKPEYADVYNNLSIAFMKLKQLDEALKLNKKALSLKLDFAEGYAIQGRIFSELKQFNEALLSFEKANLINPDLAYNLGSILSTKMDLCDWKDLTNLIDKLKNRINNNQKAIIPFNLLGLIDDPKLQKKAAEIYANDNFPESHALPKLKPYQKHSKIRVGYFSADFKMHPVATLTAELYETHDRAQFEIHAFSFGPDNNDEMNLRIKAGVDHFHEVRSKSDQDIALLARSLEIDIAIDLGGYTADSRTGIFAMRAAPIQASYIGVLSTMGAPYYDYLLAGHGMIPLENQKHITEKIIYLPSYQVNDSKESAPDITYARKDFGLPNKGFIFCCLNNTYKITPNVLDSWSLILKEVKGSFLLIYSDSEAAKVNLINEIILRGVDSKRVIFLRSLPRPEYLARYRVADLFLDTRPYNAGTTASDALRMGLPLLTMRGDSFNSREASGILSALDLPELITSTPKEYELLAIELATNSEKFRLIKEKLHSNLLTAALYNTSLFTENLESAYQQIYERGQQGLDFDHIYVK